MFKRKTKKTLKVKTSTPPAPPTSGSNVKKPCPYETPCGWCTKWDKKCDKKPYKRGLRVKINPIDDALTLPCLNCESYEYGDLKCPTCKENDFKYFEAKRS